MATARQGFQFVPLQINSPPSGHNDGVFPDGVEEVEAWHLSSIACLPRRILPAGHVTEAAHTLDVVVVASGIHQATLIFSR